MPSASTITVADQVPTNHVFNPITTAPGSALLETREATTTAGEKQLILQLDRASAKRATDRVTIRLNLPFEQTVDGVTSVRSIARLDCVVIVPSDTTSTERALVAALVKNTLANAVVQGYITTRDPLY